LSYSATKATNKGKNITYSNPWQRQHCGTKNT